MEFVIHVNTVITNDQNQILLVKEKKEQVLNKLNLPGGHLEIGEALVEGAKREVKEEINCDVEIKNLVGIYTGLGKDHYINFIFFGKITSGVSIANKEEINDLGWYSVEEIKKMSEEQILNPKKLKKIVNAFTSQRLIDLNFIEEMIS